MPEVDTYKSIEAPSEGLFKDNGSRFLAFAYPVESEDQVREILNNLRKEYHDARHHCVAYRIGREGNIWRASDDGEPSGSAGRPILGQIDSAGLSDICVVVVRYFGGIKLGIPGLIRAYKSSTADALSRTRIIEKISGDWVLLDFPYEDLPQVMKIVKDMDLQQRGQVFDTNCKMEVFVRLKLKENFLERINKISTFTDFKF